MICRTMSLILLTPQSGGSTVFIDETQPLDEAAKAEARLRLGWEPRSRDLMEFESRFRVRVRLPNMKHQTDLIFSDYDEDEQGSGIKAARNESLDNRNRFSMALRFTAKKTEDLNISHRIGVGRKLQPYVKSEIRKTFWSIRCQQSAPGRFGVLLHTGPFWKQAQSSVQLSDG